MSNSCANEGTSQGNTSTAATEKTETIRQYYSLFPALKKGREPPQPFCLPPPPAAWCRNNTVTDEIKALTVGNKKKERSFVKVRSLGSSITVGGHQYVRRTPSEEELYANFIKKFDSRIKALWSDDLVQGTSENVPDTPGDDTDAPNDDADTPSYDAETLYVEADTPYEDAKIPDEDADILHDDRDTTNNDLETPDVHPDTPKNYSDAPVVDVPMFYFKQKGFYDSEDSFDEIELNDDEDRSRSVSPTDSIRSPDTADHRSNDRSDALEPDASPLFANTRNPRTVCPQCDRKFKEPTLSKV